jgi:hypothetical protein
MFKPSPRAATYDVGEDLQTVLKYLARRLNVSTGTIIAMGVAAIEEAIKIQGEDSYVINIGKGGQVTGCKLSAAIDAAIEHMRSKEK